MTIYLKNDDVYIKKLIRN